MSSVNNNNQPNLKIKDNTCTCTCNVSPHIMLRSDSSLKPATMKPINKSYLILALVIRLCGVMTNEAYRDKKDLNT